MATIGQGWQQKLLKSSEFGSVWHMLDQAHKLTSDLRVLLNYSAMLSMVYLRNNNKMFKINIGQDFQRVPDSHFIIQTGYTPTTYLVFWVEISTIGKFQDKRSYLFEHLMFTDKPDPKCFHGRIKLVFFPKCPQFSDCILDLLTNLMSHP